MAKRQKRKLGFERDSLTRREFLQGSSLIAASLVAGEGISAFGIEDEDDPKYIYSAKIHPGIGVARIGSSREFYVGPEIIDPNPAAKTSIRDSAGGLKRQAAQFRVYGYNKKGEVVRELTAQEADIEWTVNLANKKASWYRFVAALDIPESEKLEVKQRNGDITGENRKNLNITPKARSIQGKSQAGKDEYRFNTGNFMGTPVDLGEIQTDSEGRLRVLGGKGIAASPGPKPKPIFDPSPGKEDTFNNADGWYDDTSDGTVDAKVTLKKGKRALKEVEGSWVIVAPPNYAPNIIGWRPLYDQMMETFDKAGFTKKDPNAPVVTSFTQDVLPILQRHNNLRWVNKGYEMLHARGTEFDFNNPENIKKLNDKKEVDFHRRVYNKFRTTDTTDNSPWHWPLMYRDTYGTFDDVVQQSLDVPKLYQQHLKNWVEGNYTEEKDTNKFNLNQPPPEFKKLTPQEQVKMLDKAAMFYCLADAFHPGCELTFPMRNTTLYSDSFRIRRRKADETEKDFGATLSGAVVKGEHGPLNGQSPGDLTRWMALPWHGDTAFCRSGYDPNIKPGVDPAYKAYLPTFWPSRVPNQVMTSADYKILMNQVKGKSFTKEERIAAYEKREHWLREFKGGAVTQMEKMLTDFKELGVVEPKPGPTDLPGFPAVIFVEVLPEDCEGCEAHAKPKTKTHTEAVPASRGFSIPDPRDTDSQRAGYEDRADHEEKFRIRFGIPRNKPIPPNW